MNPWKTLSSKIIIKNAWFELYKDKVITPLGKSGEYTYMVNLPFVIVVGLASDGFVLVKQYRYTIKKVMTEFVAGSIEGKDSALATAKREFQEETGYKAKKWVSLGEIYVAVSTNRAKGIVYLAEDLTKTDNNKMKEDGIESAIVISQKELEKQIASGEITDSKTIAAYFIAKQYLKIR